MDQEPQSQRVGEGAVMQLREKNTDALFRGITWAPEDASDTNKSLQAAANPRPSP